MSEDREALIEAAAGAFREVAPDGSIHSAPAWHDLDAEGRQEAYEQALVARSIEAAADPDGRSSTVRAVLARISARREAQ